MKKKWLILVLGLPVLLLAVWLWTAGSRQIPVDVIGDFSEKDVAEIVAAAKRELRREILPNLSWQSLKAMPAAIKRYSTIKLITILQRNHDEALIFAWQKTNEVIRFSSKTNYFVEVNIRSAEPPPALEQYNYLAGSNSVPLYLERGTNGWKHWTPRR